MLEFIVNQRAFEALPADLQAIVTVTARAANQNMLDEFTARNNAALTELVQQHGVQLRRLPDDVLLALARASEKVMQDLVASDPMAARVHASYEAFRQGVMSYHHISEQAYINAREMVEQQ
jgi:TRAP-type mannitol/chloroaromatic compound transport system substrate-binding protein